MRIKYENKSFTPEKIELIEQVEEIVDEFQEAGFVMTLRQCYYQCVSRNYISNNDKEYKRLGKIIADARLAGLLDWDAFEDRTRNFEELTTWSDPSEIIESAAYGYRSDWWIGQRVLPEVWVEKQALENVIQKASEEYQVGYFCCRGYVSLSEMHVAAVDRIKFHWGVLRQKTKIIYLGDHDPSGVDMDRDIINRLRKFLAKYDAQEAVSIVRVALNMDQVRQYNIPPNPAKLSDSRGRKYVERFGSHSWELDALDLKVIHKLIQDEIKVTIGDPEMFRDHKKEDKDNREKLLAFAKTFKQDEDEEDEDWDEDEEGEDEEE